MDIIDILLAKSMTPQGRIETYANQAQQAVSRASSALETAQSAASAASSATTQLQTITSNLTATADTEIDKLALALTRTNGTGYISNNITVSYPSNNSASLQNVVKYYTSTGNNEDGTMTQKAITQALANAGGGSGGPSNLGQENAGKIVVIDQNGNIVSSASISESDLVEALIKSDSFAAEGVIGVNFDYENYTYSRTQQAEKYTSSSDFNKYAMYGGRKRCIVSDDGQIIAFYGDNNYTQDPAYGYQVMIYQPKFYYCRVINNYDPTGTAKIIRKETLMLSPTPQSGFKIHPLFINQNGDEVDYVLLSAYEGSVEVSNGTSYVNSAITNFTEQKLASVAGANPITGANNNLTVINAEILAQNRGARWHITNMQAESALQMLALVEFCTPNGQTALQDGITSISGNLNTTTIITGSTASLGNASGAASSTTFSINGETVSYSEPGKRAISYRGMQNPWGSFWRYIGGLVIYGNGSFNGGKPYICKNFNYNLDEFQNYQPIGFQLPNSRGWISAFGIGETKYDWVFMPIEMINASSAFPIGDHSWVAAGLNGKKVVSCGGAWDCSSQGGLFYYACDRGIDDSIGRRNARLMYIPSLSEQYYSSNITKWNNSNGG